MKTLEERVASLEMKNKSLEKVLASQYHFFSTFRSETEFLRNEIEIYLESSSFVGLPELLQRAVSVFDNLQECARPVYHCIERQVTEQRNES